MYKALYRQYRPRTFSDLVGQKVIAQTLENALKENKVGHAYLFAGPRGTGKTSVAKIFAREIEGIPSDSDQDTFTDIIEIDAASNNGVDEIRNLRDAANYAPIEYPFKIYIIDEVHMLSTGAFNALLKTIEEPPAQVKFILATTEPQKIPATILSRVQRFDFRRISVEDIVARLQYVLDDQKIAYDPEALTVIANASDGGLRDALSILDQAVAVSTTGRIELSDAFEITGSSRIDDQLGFLGHLLNKQTDQAFEDVHRLLLDGKDPVRFAEDLLVLLKNLMLVKIAPELVKETDSQKIQAFSAGYHNAVFQQVIDLVADSLAKMKQTTRPELYLEILAVKIVSQQSELQPKQDAIADQVPVDSAADAAEPSEQAADNTPVAQQLDNAHGNSSSEADEDSQPAQPVDQPRTVEQQIPTKKVLTSSTPVSTDSAAAWHVMAEAVKEELRAVQDAWPDIQADFDPAVLMLAENAEPVAASRTALIFAFNHPELADAAAETADFVGKLAESLSDLLGVDYQLVFISDTAWMTLKKNYIAKLHGADIDPPMPVPELKKNEADSQAALSQSPQLQPDIPEKSSEAVPEEAGDNADVVEKAEKLFGNIVKVKGEK
ncbi:DNA polymerase III subunit gamma/tau [Oenococcus sp.]|uniref:DNA polymerase III subunit gamma/tau n=1 Tax=Oenococcus sp. TaxID=1979414 RepID=UPI0039ECBD64